PACAVHAEAGLLGRRVLGRGGGEPGRGAQALAQRADQRQLVLAPDQGEGDQALESGGDGRGVGGDRGGQLRGGAAVLEHGEGLHQVQLGQGQRLQGAAGGGGARGAGRERADPARQGRGEVRSGDEQG